MTNDFSLSFSSASSFFFLKRVSVMGKKNVHSNWYCLQCWQTGGSCREYEPSSSDRVQGTYRVRQDIAADFACSTRITGTLLRKRVWKHKRSSSRSLTVFVRFFASICACVRAPSVPEAPSSSETFSFAFFLLRFAPDAGAAEVEGAGEAAAAGACTASAGGG